MDNKRIEYVSWDAWAPQDNVPRSMASAIDFDNPLLWLLYLILAGVGVFLMKVGFDLVKSIQLNTTAVVQLTGKIEKLCEQQAASNQAQMAANASVHAQMTTHMETIRGEFRHLKDVVIDRRDRDRDDPR